MRIWLGLMLLMQAANAQKMWEFGLVTDGYIVPDEGGFVSQVAYADRGWLHLEARYNYEERRTGSLWAGYNFGFGKAVRLDITPMAGVVFGRSNGIAPGVDATLRYKRIEVSMTGEYVFTPANTQNNFYFDWPTLTYAVTHWLRAGLVAQHTRAYQTPLDAQRGFLVSVSRKRFEFTTYVFNVGWARPTWVLETGINF